MGCTAFDGCRFQPVFEALDLPNGASELWCASNDCRTKCDSDRTVLENNAGVLVFVGCFP